MLNNALQAMVTLGILEDFICKTTAVFCAQYDSDVALSATSLIAIANT